MRQIATLSLALALVVAGGAAVAQDAMTEPQIRAALEADGYTKVNDIEFEDGVWKADARSADGQRVDLRIDPATGRVYPEDQVAQLSEADVSAKLSAAGYTNVHDVDFEDGMWTAEADDPAGKDVKVTLDPANGNVVGKEKD